MSAYKRAAGYVAVLATLATCALAGVAIWTGDGRYVGLGVVTLLLSFVSLGLAVGPWNPGAGSDIAFKPLGVLADVSLERGRQDEKWGPPADMPDGTGRDYLPLGDLKLFVPAGQEYTAENLALAAQAATDAALEHGEVTLADVLLEEVFEALAESDPVHLRAELVQVAAVAVKWCEIIDARAKGAA